MNCDVIISTAAPSSYGGVIPFIILLLPCFKIDKGMTDSCTTTSITYVLDGYFISNIEIKNVTHVAT